MKSLNLSRPLLVMMLGIPGSGKSFFARQFVETFHAPLVSYDEIRTVLFVQPGYSREEEEIVTRVAAQQIRELLKTQRTFVVDGGLGGRQARQALTAAAAKYGYGSLVIWTQIDQPTARARATRRASKRDDGQPYFPMPLDRFHDIVAQLAIPGVAENHIVISGKHTFATQVKVVLKKLLVTAPRPAPSASRDGTARGRNVTVT